MRDTNRTPVSLAWLYKCCSCTEGVMSGEGLRCIFCGLVMHTTCHSPLKQPGVSFVYELCHDCSESD